MPKRKESKIRRYGKEERHRRRTDCFFFPAGWKFRCPYDGNDKCRCCAFARLSVSMGPYRPPTLWPRALFLTVREDARPPTMDNYVEYAFAIKVTVSLQTTPSRTSNRCPEELCPLYLRFLHARYSFTGARYLDYDAEDREPAADGRRRVDDDDDDCNRPGRPDRVMWLLNYVKLGISNSRLCRFWGADGASATWRLVLEAQPLYTAIDAIDATFALALSQWRRHPAHLCAKFDERGVLPSIVAGGLCYLLAKCCRGQAGVDRGGEESRDRQMAAILVALSHGLQAIPLQFIDPRWHERRGETVARDLESTTLLSKLLTEHFEEFAPCSIQIENGHNARVPSRHLVDAVREWLWSAPSLAPAKAAATAATAASSSTTDTLRVLASVEFARLCHRLLLEQLPRESHRDRLHRHRCRWRRSRETTVPNPVSRICIFADKARRRVVPPSSANEVGLVFDASTKRWMADERVRPALLGIQHWLQECPMACDAIVKGMAASRESCNRPTCGTEIDDSGNPWLLFGYRRPPSRGKRKRTRERDDNRSDEVIAWKKCKLFDADDGGADGHRQGAGARVEGCRGGPRGKDRERWEMRDTPYTTMLPRRWGTVLSLLPRLLYCHRLTCGFYCRVEEGDDGDGCAVTEDCPCMGFLQETVKAGPLIDPDDVDDANAWTPPALVLRNPLSRASLRPRYLDSYFAYAACVSFCAGCTNRATRLRPYYYCDDPGVAVSPPPSSPLPPLSSSGGRPYWRGRSVCSGHAAWLGNQEARRHFWHLPTQASILDVLVRYDFLRLSVLRDAPRR